MSKKVISIVLCLALVVALAVPALAASEVFFNKDVGGYRCRGTGGFSGRVADASFQAPELPGSLHQPDETNDSVVWIMAYDTSGRTASASQRGATTASTQCKTSSNMTKVIFTFNFNGTTFGPYTRYA